MRRASGFGVTLVSCAALVGAWKIGEGPSQPAALGITAISAPTAAGSSSTPSADAIPSATSTDPTSSTSSTTAAPTAATRTKSTHSATARSSTPSHSSSSSHPPSPSSSSTSHTTSPTPRSFTGATEQTAFGDVQVRVVMLGSRITDVVALRLTDSSSRSVQISAYAAPILRREALAAQSANIHSVSGASYTSAGYIASLQSAIDAARAA